MSLEYYLGLLDFRERIESFRRGIEAAVRDGDRVVDLGTGLGTFALFAARAGAGRVWAVDSDPVVHLARTLARENGLEGRIEFVRGRVPDVELPPDIDVVLFEDFPRRFLDDRVFRMLEPFEEGLLSRGGRMVPARARLALAPGRLDSGGRDPADAGAGDPSARRYGIDWDAVRPYWANRPRAGIVSRDHLLGAPVSGPSLPLVPVPRASALRIEGRWRMEEPGPLDALVHWFDLETAPHEWLSNRPGTRSAPWGQLLLPVDPPLEVGRGEVVEVDVRRDAFPDGAPGWIAWRVRVGGRERRGHEFAGFPAALEDLFPEESPAPDGR